MVTKYAVKRVGGMPNSLKGTFKNDYETVRSTVRKYIREKYMTSPGENPPIGLYGFSINRV